MNVADTMNGSVITVTADKTIADAAELMLRHKISGLPVVDARGALIGIITEGDLPRRDRDGAATRALARAADHAGTAGAGLCRRACPSGR